MPYSLLSDLLPPMLTDEIARTLRARALSQNAVSEVRMRRGRVASLSCFKDGALHDLPLSFCAEEKEMQETFSKISHGSAYAFEEQIKEGFLPFEQGIRVGISGRAAAKGETVSSLARIETLVFRLPHRKKGVATELFSFFKRTHGGILLFGPPGCGKTTLLHDLLRLAAKEIRTVLVDTREEFFFPEKHLLLDILSGYPKAKGAEIAIHTLSPALLALDELGAKDTAALSALVGFGVRTVATVHSLNANNVLHSDGLAPLFQNGVFSHLWDVVAGYPVSVSEGRP